MAARPWDPCGAAQHHVTLGTSFLLTQFRDLKVSFYRVVVSHRPEKLMQTNKRPTRGSSCWVVLCQDTDKCGQLCQSALGIWTRQLPIRPSSPSHTDSVGSIWFDRSGLVVSKNHLVRLHPFPESPLFFARRENKLTPDHLHVVVSAFGIESFLSISR